MNKLKCLFLGCAGFLLTLISLSYAQTPRLPIACDYYQGQEKVICNVQAANARISSGRLNEGACLSPERRLQDLNAARRDWTRRYLQPLALEKTFIGNHRRGRSFALLIDPHCDLQEVEMTVNGEIMKWKRNILSAPPYIIPDN